MGHNKTHRTNRNSRTNWANKTMNKKRKQVRWKTIFILLLIAVASGWGWRRVSPKTYTVAQITDGDTIKLSNGETIRYIGIDAPELKKGEHEAQCFAQQAKEINRKLVKNKKVKIETDENTMDRFGRTLAYVYQDNIFINQQLLEQGAGKFYLDTVNNKYQSTLIAAANQAHKEKTGLWRDCASDPEVGCLIKGNLDKLDHRWYHLPEFRHYSQVVVNLEKSDQWFCTEEEAEEAGFEKASR